MHPSRTSPDRCPGLTRPWPAADGALVRVRLPGGRVSAAQWHELVAAAREHAGGELELTSRANVQLRGVRDPRALAARLAVAGLLPSPAHDLARNLMCSPLTGLSGGVADLRPVLRAVDEALLADPALASLPGKFLVVLDDGRGDVAAYPHDLGLIATGADSAMLLADGCALVQVELTEVPAAMVDLMHRFLRLRGSGDTAAWHVREVPGGAGAMGAWAQPWTVPEHTPPARGAVPCAEPGTEITHLEVRGGRLDLDQAAAAGRCADEVVVTPWRSLLVVCRPATTACRR